MDVITGNRALGENPMDTTSIRKFSRDILEKEKSSEVRRKWKCRPTSKQTLFRSHARELCTPPAPTDMNRIVCVQKVEMGKFRVHENCGHSFGGRRKVASVRFSDGNCGRSENENKHTLFSDGKSTAGEWREFFHPGSTNCRTFPGTNSWNGFGVVPRRRPLSRKALRKIIIISRFSSL